jgi:hypothetical protein
MLFSTDFSAEGNKAGLGACLTRNITEITELIRSEEIIFSVDLKPTFRTPDSQAHLWEVACIV